MGLISQGQARSQYTLEVSENGIDWIDVSGESTRVSWSGGEQQTGSTNVAGQRTPIVVHSNKLAPITVQCDIVYSEENFEAFGFVRKQWDSPDMSLYLRYSPRNIVGAKRYYTADEVGNLFRSPITTCLPPEGDATSGDPMMASFSVLAPRMAEEIIT